MHVHFNDWSRIKNFHYWGKSGISWPSWMKIKKSRAQGRGGEGKDLPTLEETFKMHICIEKDISRPNWVILFFYLGWGLRGIIIQTFLKNWDNPSWFSKFPNCFLSTPKEGLSSIKVRETTTNVVHFGTLLCNVEIRKGKFFQSNLLWVYVKNWKNVD